jgi:hypothetical protein
MGCDRALGQAVEQISTIDAATTPPWSAHVSEAGISDYQGAAHYTLALANGEPNAAGRGGVAAPPGRGRLSPDYVRLRALYLPDLAGAHAIAGDTDTASPSAIKPSTRLPHCTPPGPMTGCAF